MLTSLWLACAGLVAAWSAAGGAGCESCAESYCSDAGAAPQGTLVTSSATIGFAIAEDGLRLTVRHRGSRAETVLDLPYPAPKRAHHADEGGAGDACDPPAG
ncbi:MAG: hypothetical protein ABJF09_02650 [Qipengyuania citrea]|uniref:hypothetical protein n=1 Tax=Qipengyuania citrea TaxID=225971 RepID=UPI0032652969